MLFIAAMYFIAHITSSVFINDDERGLHADYEDWQLSCWLSSCWWRWDGSSCGGCSGAKPTRSQADKWLSASGGDDSPRQPVTKAYSEHRLASFVRRHRWVGAGRFAFVLAPPCGENQVDRRLAYPQLSSSGKTLSYLTLERGSAIISATVSRQTW